MIAHQEHLGRKFYQDKKNGYWISTDYPRIRAHRWAWIKMHGNIPNGYHIHHKNEDKSDNRIENLELIEMSRHFRHHYTEEKREFSRKLMGNIRPLTKKWHASQEGRAWHKLHGIKTWKDRGCFKINCKQCSKEFETKTFHQQFCSASCKSKWRRRSAVDNEERICGKCGRSFSVNKYAPTKFCGRVCKSYTVQKMESL